MPKNVYFWGRREKEMHNTDRHMIFKRELYPYARESSEDFALRIAQFRTNHPDLCED